jgi:hypothetical protein
MFLFTNSYIQAKTGKIAPQTHARTACNRRQCKKGGLGWWRKQSDKTILGFFVLSAKQWSQ